MTRVGEELVKAIDLRTEKLENLLPRHVNAARWIRIAHSALNKDPELRTCTALSFVTALDTAAQFGLEIGTQTYMIPFRRKQPNGSYIVECQLIHDYRGLIELAMRPGEIAYVHADLVRAKDDWTIGTGDNDFRISHRITRPEDPELRGPVLFGYTIVRFRDGVVAYHWLPVSRIEAIRKGSRAAESGPWRNHWEEMAKKTVFRNHSKWLRSSSELRDALEVDYDSIAEAEVVSPPRTVVPTEEKLEDVAEDGEPKAEAPPGDDNPFADLPEEMKGGK